MRLALTPIVVLSLATASTASGQLLKGVGLKIGATAANQTWAFSALPGLDTDYRWGISGSVFAEVLDIPWLSIVAEVQYTQKGMSFSVPVTSETSPDGTGQFVTRRPRVDYLAIPVVVKVRLETSLLTPYMIAGPRYDILLMKYGEGFDVVVNAFSTTEPGLTVGLGVESGSLLPVHVLAEIRYNTSLKDSYATNFLRVRNRTYDILLGVRM